MNMIHLRKNNENIQAASLISIFRGYKFREYHDTFTEMIWNIKSRKKFFIE